MHVYVIFNRKKYNSKNIGLYRDVRGPASEKMKKKNKNNYNLCLSKKSGE